MPGGARILVRDLAEALDEESGAGQHLGILLQRPVNAVKGHAQPIAFDTVGIATTDEPRPADDKGPLEPARLDSAPACGLVGMWLLSDHVEVVPVFDSVEGLAIFLRLVKALDRELVEQPGDLGLAESSRSGLCPVVPGSQNLSGEPTAGPQGGSDAGPERAEVGSGAVREAPSAVNKVGRRQRQLREVVDLGCQPWAVADGHRLDEPVDGGLLGIDGEHGPAAPQQFEALSPVAASEVNRVERGG